MKRLIAHCFISLSLIIVSCSKDDIETDQPDTTITITEQILQLSNEHRAHIGIEGLIRSSEADKIAEVHTRYMIDRESLVMIIF